MEKTQDQSEKKKTAKIRHCYFCGSANDIYSMLCETCGRSIEIA